MPELPEVEDFRQLLLPLVSSSLNNNNNNNNNDDDDDFLHLERLNLDKKPPRKFLSDEDIESINQHQYYVQDVLRRGKLICMVLESSSSSSSGSKEDEDETTITTSKTKYLYIHMGMTGRISTSDYVPNLVELKKDSEYPPPHTYLKFSTTKHEACFSDPRKFGSIVLQSNKDEFDQLAPDALMEIFIMEDDDDETDNNNDKKKKEEEEDDVKKEQTTTPVSTVVKPEIITKLTNQSMGIKPLLLDQKRVISGVGNWVADEVLYQTQTHPDQNYLSQEESHTIILKLHHILQTAVNCLLSNKKQFPKEWLFNYRWNNKQTTKDVHGRTVTFITSGGRTSAIVPSIQKKKGRKKLAAAAATATTKETNTTAANKNTKKKKRHQKEEEEPVALNDDSSDDDNDDDTTNKKPKAKKIKKTTTTAAAAVPVGSSSSNDKKIIRKKDESESSSRNPPTTKKKTNNKKGGKKQKASPPDLAQTAGGGNSRRRSPRFS